MNKIILFTHNDLDALGCALCVREKFKSINLDKNFKMFNTNYKNIEVITQKIKDEIERSFNQVKLLIIADVSFSDAPNSLRVLNDCAKEHGVKIIFIDHHMYSEHFFDEFSSDSFKVHHDVSKSASLLCYEFFGCTEYEKVIKLIDIYDLWKLKSEFFWLASAFNSYFWEKGGLDLIESLEKTKSLPVDLLEFKNEYDKNALEYYEKLQQKNLLFRLGDCSFSFADEFFNEIIQNEHSIVPVVVVATSYGALRIRISDNAYSDDTVKSIREKVLDGKIVGHLRAFSYNIQPHKDIILSEFKRIYDIINEITKD